MKEAKSERIGILLFLNERKYLYLLQYLRSYVGKLIGCLYLATT